MKTFSKKVFDAGNKRIRIFLNSYCDEFHLPKTESSIVSNVNRRKTRAAGAIALAVVGLSTLGVKLFFTDLKVAEQEYALAAQQEELESIRAMIAREEK